MMYGCLVFVILLVGVSASPPLKLTIDCSEARESIFDNPFLKSRTSESAENGIDVESFCKLIQRAIPKDVRDGKFVLIRSEDDEVSDQEGLGNEIAPISILPPKSLTIPKLEMPKIKIPKLKIPKISVPKLKTADGLINPPRVGNSMSISLFKTAGEEKESSAERVEKFKKGVQKMLHVVKVLSQIDQYLSERTRIIVDKLAKTLAE